MSEGSRHQSEGGALEVAKGEPVEKELAAIIERRSRQKDSDEEYQLWRESVRRYNARRQKALRRQWCQYHQDQAASEDLASAVFVAAERRGLGDLMHRYFDEVDCKAGVNYQEWSRLPSEDVLKCQRECIERVVHKLDHERLVPPACAITF
jgi:hypothetical protein